MDITAQLPQLEAAATALYTTQARVMGGSGLLPALHPPDRGAAAAEAALGLCQRALEHGQRGRDLTDKWLVAGPAPPSSVQDPQERAQAEQALKVFGMSTEYVAHCKVRWSGREPRGRRRRRAAAAVEPWAVGGAERTLSCIAACGCP